MQYVIKQHVEGYALSTSCTWLFHSFHVHLYFEIESEDLPANKIYAR